MKPSMPTRRRTGAPALVVPAFIAAALATATAGCASGSGHPAGTFYQPSASPSSSATDPAALARTDAAARLASFTPPPDAVRSAGKPSGTPSALAELPVQEGVSTKIISTGWWTVDTAPDAVYSWLTAQQPESWGTIGSPGTGVRIVTFSKPPTPVLAERTITVSIAPLSETRTVKTRTVLRVDAQDVYRASKPRSEVVPVTASLVVNIQTWSDPAVPRPSPRPVTITDRAKIAKVADTVNALPRSLDAVRSCPLMRGPTLVLDFKDSPTGPDRAVVQMAPGGCAYVGVTIDGAPQPSLDAGGVQTKGGLVGEVAATLGVALP